MTAAGGDRLDLGGTIRARPPKETLRRLAPRLGPLGITRVARVTGLDTLGLATSVSIRPASRHLSTAQGKGITPELADVSAIMESIEGWHAESVPPPELTDSPRRLSRRASSIDPAHFPLGPRWRRISADRPIGWSRASDLRTGEPVWIPHAVTVIESTLDHPERCFFRVSSNGLAAGNTPAEALCHALYEVVERDSEWRWTRKTPRQQDSTLLDPATVHVPFLRSLLDRARAAGLQPSLWDMTGDAGIPAYRCILADLDPSRGLGWFQGAGAHLSPEVALSRALTEAAQSRLTWIVGTREDIPPEEYVERASLPWRPPPRGTSKGAAFGRRRAPHAGRSLEEDLGWIVRRLSEAGHPRIVAVDHTRPDPGIPVVHVFVPGMQMGAH